MSKANYPQHTQVQVDRSQIAVNAIDRSDSFNIETALDNLKELILSSSHIPLTDLAIVEENALLEQLLYIQENLPPELATAIEIVNRQQEIIAEARGYACLIVKSAEEKAHEIVRESAIVRQAELDGARIRLKTERECEQLRQNAIAQFQAIQMDADSYADRVLEDLEIRLQQMTTIVKNGRCQLTNKERELQ